MPTNFLPVGIINEKLEELAGLAAKLSAIEGADEQAAELGVRIFELATGLLALINGFSSQPLLFTGSGSTEEIISRLEWLLTFDDNQSANRLDKPPRKRRKNP